MVSSPDSSSRVPAADRMFSLKVVSTAFPLPLTICRPGQSYIGSRVKPGEFHPIISYLFTEWKCNLDCHYCRANDNRVPGMTEDVARRSIDWLHDSGCRVLALMGGEVLLRPQFVHKVVDYAVAEGLLGVRAHQRPSDAPRGHRPPGRCRRGPPSISRWIPWRTAKSCPRHCNRSGAGAVLPDVQRFARLRRRRSSVLRPPAALGYEGESPTALLFHPQPQSRVLLLRRIARDPVGAQTGSAGGSTEPPAAPRISPCRPAARQHHRAPQDPEMNPFLLPVIIAGSTGLHGTKLQTIPMPALDPRGRRRDPSS